MTQIADLRCTGPPIVFGLFCRVTTVLCMPGIRRKVFSAKVPRRTMKQSLLWAITLLGLIKHTFSLPSDYGAAIVQFAPEVASSSHVSEAQATAIMLRNIKTAATYVDEAKKAGSDIIVFPEQSFSGFPYTDHASVTPYLIDVPDAGNAHPLNFAARAVLKAK